MNGGSKQRFILGPTCDPELAAVGITSLDQLRALGWEESAARWIEAFPSRANLNAVVGVMAAIEGIDWRTLDPASRALARSFVSRHKLPARRRSARR